MKIIKKIAAIMLSVMKVLGMCSMVGAADGTKGKITINNAISGQTYKIYKILTLESYDNADGKNLYSYKPADDKWDAFFRTGAGKDYVDINENGYVEWKAVVGETEVQKNARAAELAQKALKYATDNTFAVAGSVDAKGSTVIFNDLDLGYYLVDSSLGTLCGLTTTDYEVIIQEKNGVPTVDKKIKLDNESTYTNLGNKNSANLGDTVIFQTTINVQLGTNNYILHDEMDTNLTFGGIHEVIPLVNGSEGTALTIYCGLVTTIKDQCTFELQFTDKFYQEYADKINDGTLTKIYVRYMATVNENATIDTAMKNTTYLTYSDKNTQSNKADTETYTYGIPVLKYTMTDRAKSGLAGAKFSLNADNNNAVGSILNFKNTGNEYRYTDEAIETTGTTTILQSPANGDCNINGLKAGTYWLKETEAPKGYNQLAEPIKIIIEQNANGTKIIKNVKDESINRVEVLNKSGSLLPSTGGMGTTLFYIFGAILVIGSGVVLITKKRMK